MQLETRLTISCLQCNWSVEATSTSGEMAPWFLEGVQQSHAGRNEQHVLEIVCDSILLSRDCGFGVLKRWKDSVTGNVRNNIYFGLVEISDPQMPIGMHFLGHVNADDL